MKQNLFGRIGNSIAGLAHAVKSEPNMRIHFCAAIGALAMGAAFQIDRWEWVAVIGCIGAVIGAECLNTAIERLADRVEPNQDPLIGQAKDCAAAGVLCTSIAAAIIGAIVFLPRVYGFIS